jgi:carboxylesterase
MDLGQLSLFEGDEHRSFLWEAGKPAALLVHGFLGTPAEFRPLAGELLQAGWTVQGVLLPGFGAQIDALFERRYLEWIEAASAALITLKKEHDPVLLVGFSMGGAVALNVAAKQRPSGLVLLAPFWRNANGHQRALWEVIRRLRPHFRPFEKTDFSDPGVRESLGGFAPDLDLDDPKIRESLRQLRAPSSFLDQVLALGRDARRSAPQVNVPTLIVQGMRDESARPELTRELLGLLPGPIHYHELDAEHRLLRPEYPWYSQVRQLLMGFAVGAERAAQTTGG